MVKSMFAGVAGLRAHQSKMDVIGNNIANVNTWGYKAANMSFKDAMYQSTSAGSSGSTGCLFNNLTLPPRRPHCVYWLAGSL